MGRASAGGGHSSSGGGGHSHSSSGGSSRSHSSHSFSSGRASRSGGSFGGGRSSGWHSGPPARTRRYRSYGRGYSTVGSSSGCLGVLVFIIIIAIIAFMALNALGVFGSDVPRSTVDRQRLDTSGISYNEDCVTDEIGWMDSSARAKAGRGLKYFWEETGVQPYVLFLDYSRDWDEKDEQSAYADEYYDSYIDDESSLLVVYFNDAPGDAGGWGNWEAVKGQRVDSVMDGEAMDIFWNYLDSYWYGDYSEAEVLVNTFTDTADRIMTRTRTAADVAVIAGIIVLVLIVIFGIVTVMKTKRRHEREKAEETERILNTPLEEMKDPTLEKYSDEPKEPADDGNAAESGPEE